MDVLSSEDAAVGFDFETGGLWIWESGILIALSVSTGLGSVVVELGLCAAVLRTPSAELSDGVGDGATVKLGIGNCVNDGAADEALERAACI